MNRFKIGDHVEKAQGYRWPGVIISLFETTGGKTRCVVECTAPEVEGALHIYNLSQLRKKGQASAIPAEERCHNYATEHVIVSTALLNKVRDEEQNRETGQSKMTKCKDCRFYVDERCNKGVATRLIRRCSHFASKDHA